MGVWIEIMVIDSDFMDERVAPFVGVWIEIFNEMDKIYVYISRSLCGSVDWNRVLTIVLMPAPTVAPFVGVWIEIYLKIQIDYNLKSLPLWECGLK